MVRVARESRSAAVAGLAGATAGLLVAGVGGRIVMRISMLIANGSVEGRLTENGNRVGEFTVGGTLGLLIFGGVLTGVIGGIVWYAVRPWVRRLGRLELPAAATGAVALVGFQIIDPENRDFVILEPAGRQVALFLGLVTLAGLATALFDRLYERVLPRKPGAALVYLPVVALGVVFLVPTFGTMLTTEFCFCEDPPRIAGFLLLATFAVTVVGAVWRLTDTEASPPQWLTSLGTVSAIGAVTAGMIHLIGLTIAVV